jgi:NADH:ubiquinone oxidoreductase subunit 3 (subunit A)
MEILSSPPIAFLVYLVLVSVLIVIGRLLAGPANPSPSKSSPYGSGEEGASYSAAPGYRPFFRVALFFAILHLGVIVLGTSTHSPSGVIYLLGLMLALIALILG